MQRHGDPSYTQCGTSPIAPPNVGLYIGVGTGSAPGNVGWNTGVTTLTQCGAEPMVAVCTHVHVGLDRYPFGRPLHLVSLALAAVASTAPSDVFLAVGVADVGTVPGAAADWARSRVDIPGVVLGLVVRAPDSGPPAADCPVVPPSAVFFGVVVPAFFERRERFGYGLLCGRADELGTDNHADQLMHGGFPPGSLSWRER